MLLRAAIEPRAAESSGCDPAGERREIVVEAVDFAEGRKELTRLTPEGWRVVWIRVGG